MKNELTHINHESTLPNKHLFSITALFTSGMLSINQRIFEALKYVERGRPQRDFRNSAPFLLDFEMNCCTVSLFLTSNHTKKNYMLEQER